MLMACDREPDQKAEVPTAERGLMLAAIAHDLASPVGAIVATAQMLERSLGERGQLSPDRLEQAIRIIARAATRVALRTEELLDIARLEAGEPLALHPVQVDLVALVTEVAADHRARASRHTIRLKAAPAPIIGFWDALRLRRMLDNLIENAIRYSPDGGTVTLSVRLVRGGRGASRRNPVAEITVRDTGIGIPASDLPHVFTPFRRAGNVGTIAGSGIGLASARQIVEHQGGTIAVESRVGRGSTFIVRLPLLPETFAAAADQPPTVLMPTQDAKPRPKRSA